MHPVFLKDNFNSKSKKFSSNALRKVRPTLNRRCSSGGGSWLKRQSYSQKVYYCPFLKYSKPKPPVMMKTSTTKKIITIVTKPLNFIIK